ncbi:MAG: hypothetical protein OXL34_18000 [Gemmatimonadota bacterium]|nr:hypothetical protein [Gemmatimonadota bacterium]
MVDARVALLLYGAVVMNDLPLLDRWGMRRIFGWLRVAELHDLRAMAAGAGRAHGFRSSTPCCGVWPSWRTRRCTHLREIHSSGSWQTAQPKRLRLWLFRLLAKLTAHARRTYLRLLRGEPVRQRLLAELRALDHAIPPRVPV